MEKNILKHKLFLVFSFFRLFLLDGRKGGYWINKSDLNHYFSKKDMACIFLTHEKYELISIQK